MVHPCSVKLLIYSDIIIIQREMDWSWWRKWWIFLAQVCFLGGDLRRKSGSCALQWRMSYLFFHTCATNLGDLRHQLGGRWASGFCHFDLLIIC